DGALLSAKLAGDLFVEPALHHPNEYFTLTPRQAREAMLDVRDHLAALASRNIQSHCSADSGQQLCVAYRLADEVHGAALQCTNTARHICLTRDEDDRSLDARIAQCVLHLQAAQAGQRKIQEHTSRNIGVMLE
ncbi:MAG TPA: hypothetical protein VFO35_08880, partial [Steroidobacteraceae bacterium]|nr:hypothetical protein [Steroidobacteraceae bacterium]